LGPSGVGKSSVAMRLAGKNPEHVKASRGRGEVEKFIADLKKLNIISPPGHYIHGEYLSDFEKSVTSNSPPPLIIFVAAAGYHATAEDAYIGRLDRANYNRPGLRGGKPRKINTFVDLCLKEEEAYLEDIIEKISGKMKKSIPWVITIANKKDLWWDERESVIKRYSSIESEYGKRLYQVRGNEGFGGPDQSTSNHIVFPAYLSDNGFSPNPAFKRTSLTQAHMEADSMILRALVFHKYLRGA